MITVNVWEEKYCAAVLETDDTKLVGRIADANASIGARLEELLKNGGGTPEEQKAITDALRSLIKLKRERLG
jgi:hypothetical protein